MIYRNVVLMGSNFFGPGERHIGPHLTTSKGEKGDVHAYDARTGKKVWDFHTIRCPARSATTRGATTAGRIAPATTSGRSR